MSLVTCLQAHTHIHSFTHARALIHRCVHHAAGDAEGELTLADLLHGLGGEGRKKLPAPLRKELQRMSAGTKSQVRAWSRVLY